MAESQSRRHLRDVASGVRTSSGRSPFVSSKDVCDSGERHAEYGAGQIDVVPHAIRLAPSHRREQMQRFGKVTQHHDDETRCANKLKYCRHSFARNEHGNRIQEQQEDGHGPDQYLHQHRVHRVTIQTHGTAHLPEAFVSCST